MKDKQKFHLVRDIALIFFSFLVAIVFAQNGGLSNFLQAIGHFKLLGAFICGIFFISMFTVAPAAVVLVGLFQSGSLLAVALFAGLGGVVGDLFIFRFVKNSVAADIEYLLDSRGGKRFLAIFQRRIFRFLTPLIGAIIIASPLPDEIGVSLLGLSKVKTSLFIPLSFFLNFLGVLLIGLIVRGIY